MLYYLFIILYMGIIALGSLLPFGVPHRIISHQDKVIHFFLYVPLGFLLSFPKMPSSFGLTYLLPLGIGAVYGISMELLQSLLPYRIASFWDAGANCSGVFLGLIIGWAWCLKRR
jgi:VanZ family protein